MLAGNRSSEVQNLYLSWPRPSELWRKNEALAPRGNQLRGLSTLGGGPRADRAEQ